jgi:hypothetical protein
MKPEQGQRERVEEWLRVHRAVLGAEAAFTELAMQAAAGELSVEELNRQRTSLMQLRARCNAVYEEAFPSGAAGQP